MSQDLGDILLRSGALDEEALRQARARQRGGGHALENVLVEMGLADEATVWRALAKANGLPFVDLSKGKPSAALLERIPAEFAREQGV
ncbi:MAG: secretion system protein E, partial [Planctomycetota bacterium]